MPFIRRTNTSTSTYNVNESNGDGSFGISGVGGNVGDVTVANISTPDRALESVDSAVTGALSFGGRALDSVDRNVLASIASSAQSAAIAIAAAQMSARDALGSNERVTNSAMDLTNKAMGSVATSFADSLNFAGHISDLALQASARVDKISAGAIDQIARSYDTATNYQAEKSTLDSRYMVVAGLIVIGLAAIRAFGGKA